MSQLNWDDARIFLALARTGTLTAAAERLNSGAATISRRIDRLEQALGVPLFLRHQSGYRLTDQGEALLPRAEAAEQAVQELLLEAGSQDEVAGLVRLASIGTLIEPVIVPALTPLLARHPMLDIEVLFNTATVNLHRRDADLALRMVRPERGNLLVRQVAVMGLGLYGTAGGAQSARHITWPDQESLQPILGWSRAFGADAAPRLAVNTVAGQVEAVRQGAGIAVLPHILARAAGLELLHDVLPDGAPMERPIYLVTHADLAHSRRVSTVAECLVKALNARRTELAGKKPDRVRDEPHAVP